MNIMKIVISRQTQMGGPGRVTRFLRVEYGTDTESMDPQNLLHTYKYLYLI